MKEVIRKVLEEAHLTPLYPDDASRPFLEVRIEQALLRHFKSSFSNAGDAVNALCAICHAANRTWWMDLQSQLPKERNVGELLMLTVSELAEAMEGHRKGLMDDKLPDRKMIEVELADALIRIFDMGAGLGLDLGGAFVAKMEYNGQRADHKLEARLAEGGKKY